MGAEQRRGMWRSRWAAVGAAVAVTLGVGGIYSVSATSAPSAFVAISPVRVLDTRIAQFDGALRSRTPRLLDVTGSIDTVDSDGSSVVRRTVVPDGATAIVANVTAVSPSTAGFVAVRPGTATGAPTTSSLNVSAGVVVPNSVTVELPTTGANAGRIQLWFTGTAASATTHLLVDIVGYYQAGAAGPRGPAGPAGNTAEQQRFVTLTNGPTPLASDFETQPAIALGADRLPIVAYFNQTLDDLYVVRCISACGGTAGTAVESTGSVGFAPSVAIGSDGLAVIVHASETGTGLRVRHCSNVACDVSAGTPLDAAAATGTPSAIAIGTDGLPIIAYPVGNDVRTAHCADVACTSSVRTTHTTSVVDGVYISLAIGSDGLPVIAHQTGDGDLAVTHCTNVACTSSTQAIADNRPVVLGYDAAIAIGVDGFPVIAHRVLTSGTLVSADLRITHCTNISCSSAVSTTVDAGPNQVGEFASIAVGADGMPIVAYRDETADSLRIARCTDATCGAVDIIPNDAGPGSGFSTAIVIDALGLPVIAHMDDTTDTTNTDVRLTILTSQGWGP